MWQQIKIFLTLRPKIKFRMPNKKVAFILIFKVTFKFKFNVKGRCSRFRPEIVSAGVPKWSQVAASLSGQLTKPSLSTWHLARARQCKFDLMSMSKTSNYVKMYIIRLALMGQGWLYCFVVTLDQ